MSPLMFFFRAAGTTHWLEDDRFTNSLADDRVIISASYATGSIIRSSRRLRRKPSTAEVQQVLSGEAEHCGKTLDVQAVASLCASQVKMPLGMTPAPNEPPAKRSWLKVEGAGAAACGSDEEV